MLLEIICSLFDMALWIIFYNGILKTRKEFIPFFVFISSYLICETILFAFSVVISTNYSDYRVITNTFLSFVFSFALTHLYECKFTHKLFVSMIFVTLSLLSEILVYQIIMLLPTETAELFLSDQTYGAITSKIISLLLCSITILFFNRKEMGYNIQYTALILIMPIVSLIILFTIPIRTDSTELQTSLSIIGMVGILIANLVNYYLLDNILHVQQLKEKEAQLDQQIKLQLDKYQQISQAYRSSRSFIHDIKKQYFYIQSCIKNDSIQEISTFLEDALYNLEATATKVNTGNLVIDSFISNHMTLCEQEGILFHTKLQIDLSKISISDYDLCLILGNLLDNSFQACKQIPSSFSRVIEVDIFTSSLEMVIHISNSIIKSNLQQASEKKNELLHGFGTTNIERITSKYNGTYTHQIINGCYHAIISIPYIPCP